MAQKLLAVSSILILTLLCGSMVGQLKCVWAAGELSDELSEDTIPDGFFDEAPEPLDTGVDDDILEAVAGDLDTGDPDTEGVAAASAENQAADSAPLEEETLPQTADPTLPPVVDEVLIGGNDRVEEEAIHIRISSLSNLPLNRETVDADVRSIYEMGFFHNVEARLDRENGRTLLTYWVKERPHKREERYEQHDSAHSSDRTQN